MIFLDAIWDGWLFIFIKVSKINEHPIYAQCQENVIYSAAVKDKKLKFQQKEFSEERAYL